MQNNEDHKQQEPAAGEQASRVSGKIGFLPEWTALLSRTFVVGLLYLLGMAVVAIIFGLLGFGDPFHAAGGTFMIVLGSIFSVSIIVTVICLVALITLMLKWLIKRFQPVNLWQHVVLNVLIFFGGMSLLSIYVFERLSIESVIAYTLPFMFLHLVPYCREALLLSKYEKIV